MDQAARNRLMAAVPGAGASGRGAHIAAAAWALAALLFLSLTATPFALAEYSGIAGRGQWFAVGMALACLLAAAIAAAGAPATALLAGVVFLGGIAELWLTEPDWFSAVVLAPKSRADLAMLALLALEAAVALAALWTFAGRRLLDGALRSFGFIRPAILLALLTLASVSLFRYLYTGDLDGYAVKLVVVGGLTGIHLAAFAALLVAPDLPRLAAVLRGAARVPVDPALAFAALAFTLSACLALAAFHGLGAVEDETAYLFQARTFAAGMLAAPPLPPGLAPAFDYYLLDARESGWFAATSPGWPAVLALGVLAGTPWLVNPLLAAASVFLAHRLVERCADRATADLAGLLLATSPWLLGTAASLMTHTLSGALIAGAWLALVVAGERFAAGRGPAACALALLAGLLMGWLFLTRALEGVLIGGLSGLWLLGALRSRGGPIIASYMLGCIATGSLLFAYNAYLTGDPLVMPLAAYLDRLWGTGGNDFGFGPQIGPPDGWRNLDLWPGHSPLEGLVNTISALSPLNRELFGWPAGSLLLIAVLLLWGRMPAFARAMAAVAAAVVLVHVCYWFNAVFYVGPRYWHAALLPLVVLAACGARVLAERLDAAGLALARERVLAASVLLALFAAMIFLPWRGIEKYAHRVAASHAIEAWADRPEATDALVFLPLEAFKDSVILQDPLLGPGRPVFVQDLGPAANAQAIAAFPGRRAIRADCADPVAGPDELLALCAAIGERE